jgi:phage host-nuclease inhibitor protein Gam
MKQMTQQILSTTHAVALRGIAQREVDRLEQERGERKAAIERETAETWAQEREIDRQYEPQIADLERQLTELLQQENAVRERIQAVRMEMSGKKVAPSERRTQLRLESLAILQIEQAEEACEAMVAA